MDLQLESVPRTYRIRRSQHLGYGFVAGHESPTMVKMIEPNGPSFKRLLPGDIIMAVNGIDVEDAPREQIIKMIQLCDEEIEIKVRQPSYEEVIRARNLTDPKFYTLNRLDSQEIQSRMPKHIMPMSQSPFKRSMTSMSGQEQNLGQSQLSMHNDRRESQNSTARNTSSSSSVSQNALDATSLRQPRPIPDNVLRQNFNNRHEQVFKNNPANITSGNRSNTLGKYGRHSPVPPRCKSSMDGTQTLRSSKKTGDHTEPKLRRSNTMRPIKPPAKVMEIFQVVTKIFFEDGRTRVLNYDQDTTVGTILETLNARITGPHAEKVKKYFGLALTVGVNPDKTPADPSSSSTNSRNWLVVLDEDDSIMKIRKLWYARILRFFYRMVCPPHDVYELYCQDKVAFDYLYQQSCNDLKLERFDPELDQDTILKLSVLHLIEYVYSHHSKAHGCSTDPKVYIRLIKKEPGFEYFLPKSTIESLVDRKGKRKKLKARLSEQIRKNFEEFDLEPPKVRLSTNSNRYSSTSFHELCLPELQSSPSAHIKLVFLDYLSRLPCYDNLRRPKQNQESPLGNGSACERSSSIDSMQKTSDSSSLLKQERTQNSLNGTNRLPDQPVGNMSRLAQMNSMRSLNSIQSPPSISQPSDRPDVDSIDSVSSITFNMQSSDSPQPAPSYQLQSDVFSVQSSLIGANMQAEPLPMPRQQSLGSKTTKDSHNSLEGLYSQRYTNNDRHFEEMLRNAILLPPPPPIATMMFDDLPFHIASRNMDIRSANSLTQVLTEQDLEELKVPPPPRIFN